MIAQNLTESNEGWTVLNSCIWQLEEEISRSEQAPGSGFNPSDKSTKIDFCFLGPHWCNKKVDHEK